MNDVRFLTETYRTTSRWVTLFLHLVKNHVQCMDDLHKKYEMNGV